MQTVSQKSKRGCLSALFLGLVFFILGNVSGFFVGVYSTGAGKKFLEDVFSPEEKADSSHPKDISRAGFRLKIPANWAVDTLDADYNPDHSFTIESPGSSFVMFIIMDIQSDPLENVQEQVEAFVPKVINKAQRIVFKKWGKYEGQGMQLRGRVISVVDGGVRIFSYSSEYRSFIVVESYFAEDLKKVQPGFQLIEDSFEILDS